MIYGDCFLSLYRQYEFEDLGCSLLLCECHSASLRSAVHLYGNNSYVGCRASCAQCLLCTRSSCQCVVLEGHLDIPYMLTIKRFLQPSNPGISAASLCLSQCSLLGLSSCLGVIIHADKLIADGIHSVSVSPTCCFGTSCDTSTCCLGTSCDLLPCTFGQIKRILHSAPYHSQILAPLVFKICRTQCFQVRQLCSHSFFLLSRS